MRRPRVRLRDKDEMMHRRGLTLPSWSASLAGREIADRAAMHSPSNRFERRKGKALLRKQAKQESLD